MAVSQRPNQAVTRLPPSSNKGHTIGAPAKDGALVTRPEHYAEAEGLLALAGLHSRGALTAMTGGRPLLALSG